MELEVLCLDKGFCSNELTGRAVRTEDGGCTELDWDDRVGVMLGRANAACCSNEPNDAEVRIEGGNCTGFDWGGRIAELVRTDEACCSSELVDEDPRIGVGRAVEACSTGCLTV